HDNPGRVSSTTFTRGDTTLGSLAYGRNTASQIASETSVGLGPSRTFTYDTVGRVATDNDAVYHLEDADNLTTNPAVTPAFDGANTRVDGPVGTPVEPVTGDGTTTYRHADQLGSIRLPTDVNGTVTGTAGSTAFGTRATTGATVPFGFAGQYTDAESGLVYLR